MQMADSEAQTKVWTDLALTPVQLSSQLSDEQLRSFLPVIFPGLKLLMIHAEGSDLKLKLAELMQRIAGLYQFSFDLESSTNWAATEYLNLEKVRLKKFKWNNLEETLTKIQTVSSNEYFPHLSWTNFLNYIWNCSVVTHF